MVVSELGTVSNGGICLDKPLPFPDGCKVIVQVELEAGTSQQTNAAAPAFEEAFPLIGQWADRDDIVDSADYVRQERAKWQQRPYRQD